MDSKTSSRHSSIDESRPLNPDHGEGPSRSLNPDMVQPPLTPPGNDYREPGSNYELSVRMITILRSLALIFTIANITTQLVCRARNSLDTFLIVWDWFILAWCILGLLAENRLPSISITVGNWTYSAGAGRDYRYDPPQKRTKTPGLDRASRALYYVVDVVLALFLFIFSIVHAAVYRPSTWRSRNRSDSVTIDILHFFVFDFMLTILILRVVQARYGVSVSFKLRASRDEEDNDRIRLPRDEDSQMI